MAIFCDTVYGGVESGKLRPTGLSAAENVWGRTIGDSSFSRHVEVFGLDDLCLVRTCRWCSYFSKKKELVFLHELPTVTLRQESARNVREVLYEVCKSWFLAK